MIKLNKVLLAAMAACSFSVFADYQVVINNGRVMDPETGLDAIRSVGINDGIIVEISKTPLKGDDVIDASNLVVAPGFIDTHFHGLDPFATKLGLKDGVTTGMDLEVGALDIDKFYKARNGKMRMNYGTTVSHEFARMKVLDDVIAQDATESANARAKSAEDGQESWSVYVPNKAQHDEIFAVLKEGLEQGAVGIGSTLGYMSTGVSAREMYEVQALAGSYGRVTSVHTRYGPVSPPPTEFVLGGHEILANAFVLDAPVLFAHINNPGWELAAEMLEKARERGLNAWGEIYPYTAGSTTAGSSFLMPDMLKSQGLSAEKNVLDPATGEFMTSEQLIEMQENNPGHLVVIFARPESWLKEWVATEGVTIGSDAMTGLGDDGQYLDENAEENLLAAHPRTAGAHSKALRIAREENIPLMTVVANLSYWSAKYLGDTGLKSMQKRGRIQIGKIADITIFDPKTVTDRATYKTGENGLSSTGIPYVMVNGQWAVKQSKVVEEAVPGMPIRF